MERIGTGVDTTLVAQQEVYEIVGSAMEVINTLGHGLNEKPYENALRVEFNERNIPYRQQTPYDVVYKGERVGQYIPDLIAYDSVIVEVKTVERITDVERGQVLNYLRVTGLKVGVILNFAKSRLEWERLVL